MPASETPWSCSANQAPSLRFYQSQSSPAKHTQCPAKNTLYSSQIHFVQQKPLDGQKVNLFIGPVVQKGPNHLKAERLDLLVPVVQNLPALKVHHGVNLSSELSKKIQILVALSHHLVNVPLHSPFSDHSARNALSLVLRNLQ